MTTMTYIVLGLIAFISAVIVYVIYKLQHKKFFFGWGNIKFVIVELIKTFSNKPSFFSSKRIERALFVGTGMGSIVYYIIVNINKLSSGEIIALSSVLLACGGYLLKQSQTEKVANTINGDADKDKKDKEPSKETPKTDIG